MEPVGALAVVAVAVVESMDLAQWLQFKVLARVHLVILVVAEAMVVEAVVLTKFGLMTGLVVDGIQLALQLANASGQKVVEVVGQRFNQLKI